MEYLKFLFICFYLLRSAMAVDNSGNDDFFDDLWKKMKRTPKFPKVILKVVQQEQEIEGNREKMETNGAPQHTVKKEQNYDSDQIAMKNSLGKFGQNPIKIEELNHEKTKIKIEKENSGMQIKKVQQTEEMRNHEEQKEGFQRKPRQKNEDIKRSHKKIVKKYSQNEKIKLFEKFEKIKKEVLIKKLNLNKNTKEIEEEIAKRLGTSRTSIHRWKGELSRSRKFHTEDYKRKIIAKYVKMKAKNILLTDVDIAEKIGIKSQTLSSWKVLFGLTTKTHYTEDKKMQLVNAFNQIREKHPELMVAEIAKRLKINLNYIYKWKVKFENEANYHPPPSAYSSDDKVWAWNYSTKKRTKNN